MTKVMKLMLLMPTAALAQAVNITALAEKVAALEASAYPATASSHMWMIICGVLVMFMQAGFAMLESGCARDKNVQSVLMKNMIDISVGTVCWFIIGWPIAYGGAGDGEFIAAQKEFFLEGAATPGADTKYVDGTMINWFFQWAFCATAATIVSGGVMERVNFFSYCIYTVIMTAFIYPIVVCNTWNYGIINEIATKGAWIDFAGSGVVHLTGGVGALVGAMVLGPRIGRFEDGVDQSQFDPHSMSLVTLGTLILWMGWYGFNCGSTLGFADLDTANLAALVACNTTISAASCGVSVFLTCCLMGMSKGGEIKLDLCHLCNGVLGGLVSITAGCGNVQPWAAMVIGLIGAWFYLGSSALLRKMKIDDPLGAFPVHGACGIWGVMAAALFDFGSIGYHGWGGWGLQENGASKGDAIIANLVEIVFIAGWTGIMSFLVFFPLHKMGMLRVSREVEIRGCDTKFAQMYAYRASLVLESPK